MNVHANGKTNGKALRHAPIPDDRQEVHGADAEELEDFLSDVCEGGTVDRIVLSTTDLEQGTRKIRDFIVTAIQPAVLAAKVRRIVTGYAVARSARTVFVLEAHAGGERVGELPIVREIKPTGASSTPAATQEGWLGHVMSQNRELIRQQVGALDLALSHMGRLLAATHHRLEWLEQNRIATAEHAAQNIVQSVDVDLLKRRGHMRLEAEEQLYALVLKLGLPALAERVAGRSLLGELRPLVASLKKDPEKMAKIGALLDEDERKALGALVEKAEKPGALERVVHSLQETHEEKKAERDAPAPLTMTDALLESTDKEK